MADHEINSNWEGACGPCPKCGVAYGWDGSSCSHCNPIENEISSNKEGSCGPCPGCGFTFGWDGSSCRHCNPSETELRQRKSERRRNGFFQFVLYAGGALALFSIFQSWLYPKYIAENAAGEVLLDQEKFEEALL